MATIGTFTKSDEDFTGSVKALTLNVKSIISLEKISLSEMTGCL